MKSQTGAPYALALVVAFGLPAETPAEQLVLTPFRDTTLSEDDVNFSNGAGDRDGRYLAVPRLRQRWSQTYRGGMSTRQPTMGGQCSDRKMAVHKPRVVS